MSARRVFPFVSGAVCRLFICSNKIVIGDLVAGAGFEMSVPRSCAPFMCDVLEQHFFSLNYSPRLVAPPMNIEQQ